MQSDLDVVYVPFQQRLGLVGRPAAPRLSLRRQHHEFTELALIRQAEVVETAPIATLGDGDDQHLHTASRGQRRRRVPSQVPSRMVRGDVHQTTSTEKENRLKQ